MRQSSSKYEIRSKFAAALAIRIMPNWINFYMCELNQVRPLFSFQVCTNYGPFTEHKKWVIMNNFGLSWIVISIFFFWIFDIFYLYSHESFVMVFFIECGVCLNFIKFYMNSEHTILMGILIVLIWNLNFSCIQNFEYDELKCEIESQKITNMFKHFCVIIFDSESWA